MTLQPKPHFQKDGEDDDDTLSHERRIFRKRKREGQPSPEFTPRSKQQVRARGNGAIWCPVMPTPDPETLNAHSCSHSQRDLQEYEGMDKADPIEFRMLARDSFLK